VIAAVCAAFGLSSHSPFKCPVLPSHSVPVKSERYTECLPSPRVKMSNTFTALTFALVSSTFFTTTTALPWISKPFNRQHYSPPSNVPANFVPYNAQPAPYISPPELTTNFPDPVRTIGYNMILWMTVAKHVHSVSSRLMALGIRSPLEVGLQTFPLLTQPTSSIGNSFSTMMAARPTLFLLWATGLIWYVQVFPCDR